MLVYGLAMASVCFVLDELYPFTSGGIGRLAHNLIQHERERGVHELHLIVPTRCPIDARVFTATFGSAVRLHRVELLPTPKQRLAWWWRDSRTLLRQGLRESHAVFDVLQRLAREGTVFDFIEFTDFLGWGAVSVDRRRALGHARIVVRLHAGFGFLAALEERTLAGSEHNQAQLEKRAVAGADLVVAHLPGPARQLFSYYFGEAPRTATTMIALPPVVWPSVVAVAVMRRSAPDILFLSKIQAVKNPELFIDACTAFFDRHPSYAGRAELACHAMESNYRSSVLARIPARWRDKIVWRPPLSAAEWRERVPGSIVVVPSTFESLCLLAYEAIAAGAVVCVNASCPAFSEDSPWADGDNCLKFAPAATALAEVLELAVFGELRLQTRLPAPEDAYWEDS